MYEFYSVLSSLSNRRESPRYFMATRVSNHRKSFKVFRSWNPNTSLASKNKKIQLSYFDSNTVFRFTRISFI